MNPTTDETKPVLSVRLDAAAKQRLIDDARNLGMKMSERAEQILLLGIYKRNDQEQIEQLQAQVKDLTQKLDEAQTRLQILNDPRLLSLFEQVKGRDDEIITPEGTRYSTNYSNTEKLLYAMIYSFTLNN